VPAQRSFVAIVALNLILAGITVAEEHPTTPWLSKWRALIPKIQRVLTVQPSSCDSRSLRAAPLVAVEFSGTSFALIDVCPLGAYTELIDVMELHDGEPVMATFRRNGKHIDAEFSQGASVMHGKAVKLVPAKRALYDISWDNDGLDSGGTVKLQNCTVDAYVWNSERGTFDFDRNLTMQSTRSYCHQLEHEVH